MSLLDELSSLARASDPVHRGELLRRLSDLFLENTATHGDREVALFDDLMTRVLDQVEPMARMDLSTLLSITERAPRRTVLKLANDDDLDVAGPVLRNSTALTTADLVGIARGKSDAHLMAIARRRAIAELVTDVLVERGSREVLHTVTENKGARFSEKGFDTLISRAGDDVGLQARLVARRDVPANAVDKLLPLLSEELMGRLVADGEAMGESLPPDVTQKLRAQLAKVLDGRDREERQVASVVAEIRQGRRRLGDVIVDFAQFDRLADIAAVVAAVSGLPGPTVQGAVSGEKEETLLVLLRSLDLDAMVLDALLRSRARRFKRPYKSDAGLVSRFLSITPDTAQRALRFHKVRASAA